MSLAQQIIYSAEQVERLVAEAFQAGLNHGYTLAVDGESLDRESTKREQERIFMQNWQGVCESREGDECGHED